MGEGKVRVKKLEWSAVNSDWHAYSDVGEYEVGKVGARWSAFLTYYRDGETAAESLGIYGSLSLAKKGVQADFERRVLSNLKTPETAVSGWEPKAERVITEIDRRTRNRTVADDVDLDQTRPPLRSTRARIVRALTKGPSNG